MNRKSNAKWDHLERSFSDPPLPEEEPLFEKPRELAATEEEEEDAIDVELAVSVMVIL